MKKFITILIILFLSTIKVQAEVLNVVFTIDNNYPIYTMLAINSILVNSDSNYKFHIIENNLSNKNKNKISKFVKKYNQYVEFYNVNICRDIISNGDDLYKFKERITPIAIARILIPEILPKNINKVLYLDGDVLVTDDLKKLFDVPLDNNFVAMAKNFSQDKYSSELYQFKNTYYNSGVILMDLDKWRKYNISNKMVKYLNNNSDKFIFDNLNEKVYHYADQDLINIVLDGNINPLKQTWNNQTRLEEIMEPNNLSGIIHYIGPEKHWVFPKPKSIPLKIYYQYWHK